MPGRIESVSMSIGYIRQKGKQGSTAHASAGVFGFVFSCVLLLGAIVWVLMMLNAQERTHKPIMVEQDQYIGQDSPGGGYYASKTGTKYFFPWCSGALNVKVSKKIFFETPQEAEAQGYKPAGNCSGLPK